MRSPLAVGMVETRTSTTLPAIFLVMRPSCGRRFSAMFSPASIFTRATMLERFPLWASLRCTSRPSMRKRTTTLSSVGSMWMSEARSFTAR